jgi:hypothetical protein
MKKQVLAAVGAVLCCAAFGAAAQQRQRAQPQPQPQPQQQDFSKVEIHALKVRDNIYMLVGSGGNITVQIGDEGILLGHTGRAAVGQDRRGDPPDLRQADPLHHRHASSRRPPGGNVNPRDRQHRERRQHGRRNPRLGFAAIIAHENVSISADESAGAAVGGLAHEHLLRGEEGLY